MQAEGTDIIENIELGSGFDLAKVVRKRNRSTLSPGQLRLLAAELDKEAFPSKERREELAKRVGCSARTVQVWFQNQRQRARKVIRSSANGPVSPALVIQSSPLTNLITATQQQQQPSVPPSSPILKYHGEEVNCPSSPKLDALVDVAMAELARLEAHESAVVTSTTMNTPTAMALSPALSSASTSSSNASFSAGQSPLMHASAKAAPGYLVDLRMMPTMPVVKGQSKQASSSPQMRMLQPRCQPNNNNNATITTTTSTSSTQGQAI